MEKLFVNALNSKLAEGKHITGSNLAEGVTLNEVQLNTAMAESLRTIQKVDAFGKGKISVIKDVVPDDVEGYIYERDGLVVFFEYAADSRSREIESIMLNKEAGTYPSYYVLQALLLLELLTDKSRLDLRDKILHFANLPFIKHNSEEANAFATMVRTLENMVSEGVFDPFEETEVDEDIDVLPYKNLLDTLTLTSIESAPVAPTADVTEEVAEPTEVPSLNEEVEQISLFNETEEADETSPVESETPTEQSEEVTAESVVLLVEAALKAGVRADDIAKTANVAPSTVYELKDLETLAKRGKNPRKSTLEKIANAVRVLHTADFVPARITPTPEPTPTVNSSTQDAFKEFFNNDPVSKINENTSNDVLSSIASSLKEIAQSMKNGGSLPMASAQIIQKEAEQKVASIDLDTVKKLRPHFFDDTWVRTALKDFELDEREINDVIEFRKASRERLLKDHPEAILDVEPKFDYMGFTEPLETLIDSVLEDLNLLFKGEAGSGKTTLIQSGSCLFNLPLYTINGSDESNIETIVGFKELEHGKIVFVPGRLVKAMTVGGIFYSDEANMIRPNILAIINGALDHRRELYNEFVGERIKGAETFRFMAAINEDYEDTRAMNRATLDRSIAMEMTYMTIEQLKNMLTKLDPEMGVRDILMLAKIATALQDGVRNEQISPEVASIRNIIYLQKMVHRRSFEKALKRIIDKYPREDRAAIVGVLSSVDRLNIKAEEILAS